VTVGLQPSEELAVDLLKPFVRVLRPGDPFAGATGLNIDGRSVSLEEDFLQGGHVLVTVVDDLADMAARPVLLGLIAQAAELEKLHAKSVVITASSDCARNRALANELKLPFLVLGDSNGGAHAACGLLKKRDLGPKIWARTLLLTPGRRLRAHWDAPLHKNHAELAMTIIAAAKMAEESSWAPPHAPVLAVPHALSPEECGLLVRQFETIGPLVASHAEAEAIKSDFKLPNYEYGRQDRVDHVIREQTLLTLIDQRLHDRVIPAIRQAFAFEVTRREPLHIARYSGRRGGAQNGHRDNRTATFHRRFALSLNLNDNYEGGEVVFREFSPRGYKCAQGTALVFSSSLLHEVEETTSGVRYTLISHFFNETSLREAQARPPQA
jgi:peroxiredoxin